MARHRAESPPRSGARFGPGTGELRQQRDRQRIAQVAARLIVEHGLTDWTVAKRKALRELLLAESTPLPSNEAIELALTEHHALFGGEAHASNLRRQRSVALTWMGRLETFSPLLIGGVAAGWATAHSDIRIELVADDPKVVEMTLAGTGVRYTAIASPPEDRTTPVHLQLDLPDGGVRLVLLTPGLRRSRSRRDDEPRLTIAAVAALLGSE